MNEIVWKPHLSQVNSHRENSDCVHVCVHVLARTGGIDDIAAQIRAIFFVFICVHVCVRDSFS